MDRGDEIVESMDILIEAAKGVNDKEDKPAIVITLPSAIDCRRSLTIRKEPGKIVIYTGMNELDIVVECQSDRER